VGAGLKILVAILLVTSIALVGMNLMLVNSVATLQQQFDDLQGKIDSTDESLNQSGAALSVRLQQQGETLTAHEEKLATHFAEIDKLWAARKKVVDDMALVQEDAAALKSQVAAYDQKIAAGTVAAKDAEAAVKAATGKLDSDLANLRKEVLAIKLGMDELEGSARSALAKAGSVESSIVQWRSKTDQRLATTEQAIQAIDSFRRNMNSELLELKSSVGDSPELDQIQRDIQLLKNQHPYLKEQ